jgi:hypothetical protein
MATKAVAQMSQGAFRKMLEEVVGEAVEQKFLELFGDPDEGLQMREAVHARLLRQREEVAAGQHGRPFEDVVRGHGME